jgi:RNA polymerase sigma factor (sigma-70 family)
MSDTLLAAKNGDIAAQQTVMEKVQHYVQSVVDVFYAKERLLWSDREDLAQEVMMDVYSHLKDCPHENWNSFCLWVRMAARHEVYNWVEKQNAKKRGGGVAVYENTEVSHKRTPQDILSEKEQNAEVLRMVAGLDESQRDVFLMALDGAQSKDISEELGIPVTQVYRLAKSAKTRMQQIASKVATGVALRELVSKIGVEDAELIGSALAVSE